MPSVILAMLDRPRDAPGLLAAAACLQTWIGGAVINALIVRIPPLATILASEEVLTRQRESQIRAQEQARAAALSEVFRDWQRSSGSSAHLVDVESVAAEAVAERGRSADFVVIERPERRGYGMSSQAITTALFETDRPVLVVPPGYSKGFGHRIAVAWRDDNRAIRAVFPALRLLAGAEQVHLLTGVRDGVAPPSVPAVFRDHGIAAQLHILPIGKEPFGQTLLTKLHKLGADVLVMGAYAHSPLREMIFGGVTRYMLEHADVPVLMRH